MKSSFERLPGRLGEATKKWMNSTHTACIGDLPGLLSLSLLLVCSMAPFSSSRMALARLPRVGFPMEAVVYRGILFSAMEACINQRKANEIVGEARQESSVS